MRHQQMKRRPRPEKRKDEHDVLSSLSAGISWYSKRGKPVKVLLIIVAWLFMVVMYIMFTTNMKNKLK